MFVELVIWLFISVIFKSGFCLFLVRNCTYVVLFRFKNSRLLLNHSWTAARMSNLVADSVELELVTMRLVSSAYNTNLAFLAVTSGKSFMYNKKAKDRE